MRRAVTSRLQQHATARLTLLSRTRTWALSLPSTSTPATACTATGAAAPPYRTPKTCNAPVHWLGGGSGAAGVRRPLSRTRPAPSIGASTRGMAAAVAAASGQPAAAATAASDDARTHVLIVCRTAEEEQRLGPVLAEMAASNPALVLHSDPASLPPAASPDLDAPAVGRRLAAGGARTMGRVLLAAAVMGSTQELLRAHGSALGDGAVVVADRQTSGKGRGGNQWTSPLGCLMFSALRRLKVQSPAQAPFINYLVCLAVTRGVRRALQGCGLPALDIRIKWPNDIYASGVKIAGALIHTTWQGNCFNVITGIGLNVNNRAPTTCLDELLERAAAAAAPAAAPTGAAAAGGLAPLPREVVLAEVLTAMEEVFDTFEQQGFASLELEYLASWLHSGQVLDFDDSDPAAALGGSGRRTRLTIRGLSASGFLLAEDAAGTRFELTPDGNSLDMMQGLLRRKLQA